MKILRIWLSGTLIVGTALWLMADDWIDWLIAVIAILVVMGVPAGLMWWDNGPGKLSGDAARKYSDKQNKAYERDRERERGMWAWYKPHPWVITLSAWIGAAATLTFFVWSGTDSNWFGMTIKILVGLAIALAIIFNANEEGKRFDPPDQETNPKHE